MVFPSGYYHRCWCCSRSGRKKENDARGILNIRQSRIYTDAYVDVGTGVFTNQSKNRFAKMVRTIFPFFFEIMPKKNEKYLYISFTSGIERSTKSSALLVHIFDYRAFDIVESALIELNFYFQHRKVRSILIRWLVSLWLFNITKRHSVKPAEHLVFLVKERWDRESSCTDRYLHMRLCVCSCVSYRGACEFA